MTVVFETAAGSVAGRSHVIAGKNCHDAWYVYHGGRFLITLVADGCGSGAHSEVGAKLGVQILGNALSERFDDGTGKIMRVNGMIYQEDMDFVLGSIQKDVLKILDSVACQMGTGSTARSIASIVNDFFLFTIVGAIILPGVSIFFSLGDGTMIVNGEKISLGPFEENAPPYLAYGSGYVKTTLKETNPDALNFVVNKILPTKDLEHFLIGTDGLDYFVAAAEKNMPGKSEQIGPLSQFWEEDRFFTNPDMVRRRLALINAESVVLDRQALCIKKEAGPLLDDTTLIAGRRIPMKEEA